MSADGFIGAVVLVVIGLVGIVWPFLRRKTTKVEVAQREHDELLTTYERILATIRDLDDDYRAEKLSPEVYQEQRAYWTERGIALLQQLEPDHLDEGDEMPDDALLNGPDSEDDAVEQAIRAYRQARSRV